MAPHHNPHQQRVAELYTELSGPVAQAIARGGFSIPVAVEATTYAFNELARRPDITQRAVSPIAWLRATARGEAERLSQQVAPLPMPKAGEAPDLMAILKPTSNQRATRKRRQAEPGPQTLPGLTRPEKS